jgi:hypothetical protein
VVGIDTVLACHLRPDSFAFANVPRNRRGAFMDIRFGVRARSACKGRVNLAQLDVPKRALSWTFLLCEESFGQPFPHPSAPPTQSLRCRTSNRSHLGSGTPPGQPQGHSPDLSCHAVDRRGQRSPPAPAPLNHQQARPAPVRGACGVTFVTTRPQPTAFVRVVTNHGSEAQENEVIAWAESYLHEFAAEYPGAQHTYCVYAKVPRLAPPHRGREPLRQSPP